MKNNNLINIRASDISDMKKSETLHLIEQRFIYKSPNPVNYLGTGDACTIGCVIKMKSEF